MKSMKMNNGLMIPSVGFGTYQSADGEEAKNSVIKAIELGYTHIDGAAIYKNEVSVGAGIKESGIKREELFLTSKVWNSERGYNSTLRAFEKTIADLGVDYLDLYLIHWPANEKQFSDNWREINRDTWRAMEYLNEQGVVKSIGLSNFLVNHLEPLLGDINVAPAINQIEFHPGFWQQETTEYCQERGIIVEGWSPLGVGKLINNDVLVALAAKYGKTTAQIALRWSLQHNVIPLPKSVTPSRIAENLDIYDFELSVDDMVTIDEIPHLAWSGLDPNNVDF